MKEILAKLKDIAYSDIKAKQKELLNHPTLTPLQIAEDIQELEELRQSILTILVDR